MSSNKESKGEKNPNLMQQLDVNFMCRSLVNIKILKIKVIIIGDGLVFALVRARMKSEDEERG